MLGTYTFPQAHVHPSPSLRLNISNYFHRRPVTCSSLLSCYYLPQKHCSKSGSYKVEKFLLVPPHHSILSFTNFQFSRKDPESTSFSTIERLVKRLAWSFDTHEHCRPPKNILYRLVIGEVGSRACQSVFCAYELETMRCKMIRKREVYSIVSIWHH